MTTDKKLYSGIRLLVKKNWLCILKRVYYNLLVSCVVVCALTVSETQFGYDNISHQWSSSDVFVISAPGGITPSTPPS